MDADTKTGSADPIHSKDSVSGEQSKQPQSTDGKMPAGDHSQPAGQATDNPSHLPTNSDHPAAQGEKSLGVLDISGLDPFLGHSSAIEGLYLLGESSGSRKNLLLSVDHQGNVAAWDFSLAKPRAFKVFKIKEGFTTLALHAQSLHFAVAYPGQIEIYSLNSRKQIFSLDRVRTRISSMDFDTKGESILLGGNDGIVYRWRFVHEMEADTIAEREKGLERYIGHASVVNIVRYHPFGRIFFSADWYGNFSAWLNYEADRYGGDYDQNLFAGREFSEGVTRAVSDRRATTLIEQSVVSKDGEFIVNAAEDGVLELWQVRGFKQVATIPAHKGAVYELLLNAEGNKAITVGRDGFLRVWQIETQPGDTTDTKKYDFKKIKELELTGFRKFIWEGDTNVLAGGLNGKIMRISVAN